MRTTVTILFVYISLTGLGQKEIKLLNGFNFNTDRCTLLGTIGSISTPIFDSLEYFYIDDTATLNDIQKNWNFRIKNEDKSNICKEFYNISICSNGKCQREYSIYFDCNKIMRFTESMDEKNNFIYDYNGFSYYFFKNNIITYSNEFKKAYRQESGFQTIHEARKYLREILKDQDLILAEEPLWKEFEGSFVIT